MNNKEYFFKMLYEVNTFFYDRINYNHFYRILVDYYCCVSRTDKVYIFKYSDKKIIVKKSRKPDFKVKRISYEPCTMVDYWWKENEFLVGCFYTDRGIETNCAWYITIKELDNLIEELEKEIICSRPKQIFSFILTKVSVLDEYLKFLFKTTNFEYILEDLRYIIDKEMYSDLSKCDIHLLDAEILLKPGILI